MIVNLIIYFFVAVLSGFLLILPDITSTSAIASSITAASGYLSALAQFLPIGTTLLILGFDLIFETGYFAFKVIYWIIRRFPTQS